MAAKWEVGPAKDVIHAFIETLVDPKLFFTASANDPPSSDAQKSVAKQMHAVVLLYNYFHRKQNPKLEFLDLVSFCKLAVSLRPTIGAFMNIKSQAELTTLNVAQNQLSLTEKSVKEACDIALELDASKDAPSIEGWPIRNVGVLLIDPKKENCLLRFGSVTEGVWSLIEKELNELSVDDGMSEDKKVGTKRKFISRKASLRQIAFDAVKETAEIDPADLVIIETHVTYSLSKEKSATQFYMMQHSKPFNTNQIVPLKFLVESLRGPLAKKYDDSWASTDFVEYYHMVPYVEFISSWLSSKDLRLLPSLSTQNAPIATKTSEKGPISTKKAALPWSDLDMSLPSKGQSSKSLTFVDLLKKSNVNQIPRATVSMEAEKVIYPEIFDNDDYEYLKGSLSCTSKWQRAMSELTTKTCSKSDGTSTKHEVDAHSQEATNIKVETPKVLKPNNTLWRDEKTTAKNEVFNNNGFISMAENPVLFRLEEPFDIEMKRTKDSIDRQNALFLLNGKRQDRCSQVCAMEDEIALYEDCIERIRDGGDSDLARRCINSIISQDTILLPKNEIQILDNIHRPVENGNIFDPRKSSCQYLEIICAKSNLRLPKYSVEPSNGKFVSKVVVKGTNFEVSAEGGLERSPCEARESAAAGIIVKLFGK